MKRIVLLLFGISLTCLSCREIVIDEEIYVYANDFETGDYTGIEGVYISEFDDSKMMGNFNNGGFSLVLNDLPEHDFIRVFFDLYIHDSWEGNTNEIDGENLGADLWIMEFDRDERIRPGDKIRFETTFSNGLCVPGWCFSQSYPNEFPFPNDARLEAKSRSTNGRCLWASSEIGTSIYRIDRVFPHDRTNTTISFYDLLTQQHGFVPVCDESWSLDNLGVSVFSTK